MATEWPATARAPPRDDRKTSTGDEARAAGTISSTLSDFKIDPPSLLNVPIKNQVPVTVESIWKKGR